MSTHSRVRAGVPTGGQFAPNLHAEADVRLPAPRDEQPTPDGVRAAMAAVRRGGRGAGDRFVPVAAAESRALNDLAATMDLLCDKPPFTEVTHSLSARTSLEELDQRLRVARAEDQSEAEQILCGYALAKLARRTFRDAGFVDVTMTADGYRADAVRDRFGDLVPTPAPVLDELTRYTRPLSTNSQATTYATHPVTPGNLWIDLDKTTGESAW